MIPTILAIVSDEEKYRLLHQQLSVAFSGGITIIRMHSEQELATVNPQVVNFVFTDVFLPDTGKISALQMLRVHFCYLPIIAITTQTGLDAHLNAIKNGVQDVVVWGTMDALSLRKTMVFAAERCQLVRKNDLIADEYKKHFDTGPIPMWVVDAKTMNFLLVNNEAAKKYGYTKSEFYRMSVPDILPQGDFESMTQKYKNRVEDNFDAGYWQHKKKDGTLFFVHIYAHATTFNNKDARLCFAVDVDKQLQMNRENMELMTLISEQKQQLDNLLLSITDALWTRNAHTLELMYGNNAYFKLHGYEQEEMTPNEDFAFKAIYPDDQPIIANAYKEIMQNGSADIVYRYVHKDGSLKTLKVQAVLKKGTDGKPDTINGITVDITKEKELLDKIQDSEHKLKATINNTKDLIWSVDVDLRIIFCNQPYSDFFKWLCDIDIAEGDYVLGDWRTAEFQQNRRTDYERALNGESFITEIEEVRNGELFYFEISSSPLKDSAGKVIGVNCISRNITEQKRNWHKIQRQNAKLKEIAWVQSHKVRGPVASILGLISLVNESIELEELSKVLGNMKMAGHELDAIIREVVAGTNEMEQI